MRGQLISQGRRFLAVVAVCATALVSAAVPAAAFRGGQVDDPSDRNPVTDGPTGRKYLLNNGWDVDPEQEITAGNNYDRTFVGDWDADGVDEIGWRRGNVYKTGVCQWQFGTTGDEVLVGDWDGDGRDTLALRRGRVVHVTDSPCSSRPNRSFAYGRPGDVVLVGDWDGDGRDTLAVRRGNEFHVTNSPAGGPAQSVFTLGRATDTVLIGDWDGDGVDGPALRRGNVYHVKLQMAEGEQADRVIRFAGAADTVLVGDWDANGNDTPALRRPEAIERPTNRIEWLAAAHGMSVRYALKYNTCRPSANGCFHIDRPYLWISEKAVAEWPTSRVEQMARFEIGRALEYKACGTLNLPGGVGMAEALAQLLEDPRKAPTAGTAADRQNAQRIFAGQCPF
ncbi:hypothetical protein KZX45_09260 [Georgenia sp. EYE_87]|uniref:hypothetical protein n=1 Tax=Georgenia sp. EYE_87 TaxID=2853448 RepID=UPI002002ED74|nr:hypothetical protein [Georgenia sp. EYE_87]MCK6210727.1 hypothetical protein [Georgenia sp. EYE_87]